MSDYLSKIAADFLELIYGIKTLKEFNTVLDLYLKKSKVDKTKLAKAIFEELKAGKNLPENSEQALRLLTYIPLPLFRKEGVFEKLLKILSPEDKKKIPAPTTVWGEQKYIRAGKKGDWKAEGYTIEAEGDFETETANRGDWIINALDPKGKIVGTLRVYNLGHAITASDVKVDPKHRRKGLASAMYEFAEKETGMRMIPADEVSDDPDNMTRDAKKFWQNRKYSESVTAGVLDFPRKRLPDSVFTYQDDQPLPKLRQDIRALILAEARNRLAMFGAELIGANLYGGAAGYQYHEGADIDVALYIDWEKFKGKHEILEAAFKTIEIPWNGFVIHLFVKPPHQREQIEVADAVYDILHDEWKIPPLVLPKGFDPEIFFQPIIELAEIKAQEIDVQMGIVSREWSKLKKALKAKAGDPQDPDVVERRIEKQKQIVQDEVNELCRIFGDVWDGRLKLHDSLRQKYVENRDVDRYERLQYPEIVWKYLDQAGYVEFLKVLIKANKNGVIEKLLGEI